MIHSSSLASPWVLSGVELVSVSSSPAPGRRRHGCGCGAAIVRNGHVRRRRRCRGGGSSATEAGRRSRLTTNATRRRVRLLALRLLVYPISAISISKGVHEEPSCSTFGVADGHLEGYDARSRSDDLMRRKTAADLQRIQNRGSFWGLAWNCLQNRCARSLEAQGISA